MNYCNYLQDLVFSEYTQKCSGNTLQWVKEVLKDFQLAYRSAGGKCVSKSNNNIVDLHLLGSCSDLLKHSDLMYYFCHSFSSKDIVHDFYSVTELTIQDHVWVMKNQVIAYKKLCTTPKRHNDTSNEITGNPFTSAC